MRIFVCNEELYVRDMIRYNFRPIIANKGPRYTFTYLKMKFMIPRENQPSVSSLIV